MIQPTFDQYGDPTDETLDAIAKWPHSDPDGWFAFVLAAWPHNCGAIRYDDKFVVFATGGWSGNESIMAAMCDNKVLWILLWESSHRGGRYVFRLPETTK